MNGLIIGSGKIGDLGLLKSLVNGSDFIICADGGIDHLRKINVIPNLALGDFDSISNEGLEFIKEKAIVTQKFQKMKDETDTELALIYLIDKGYKDITITGVTGSRMDHTIANVFLLKNLKRQGILGKIVDDNNTIFYEDKYFKIDKTDDYISIIPLNKEGISITLKGFLYPLDRKYIAFGSTMGISNKIKQSYGSIEIHSGEVLIFKSRD